MRRRLLTSSFLFLSSLLLLPGLKSMAQAPQIGAIWPPGGLRGSKATVRIEGGALGGARMVLVSGRGVQAQMGAPAADGNSLPLTLDIAADAGPGPYEVRVVTAKGASNPAYLWIGAYKEAEEKEPNNQPGEATKLEGLPLTVNGRINGGEDVDWFQFHAEANDTFAFDICANRLYSPLDAFIELRDSEGHLLGSAMEGYDRDPRLIYTFKKTGDYRLQVHDSLFRGGGNFLYRLTLGKVPAITSLYTLSGKRGETLSAQVEGINLSAMKTLSLALPADMPVNRAVWVLPETPNGPALPLAVAADDAVQMDSRSVKTNGTKEFKQATTINGILPPPKETTSYVLHGEPGQALQISVAARAIGSRMLPYLRVIDSTGKELLNTEDQIGRDPAVTFTAPAVGDYRLELSSIDAKGGPDYPYRLLLRPAAGAVAPDFHLTVTPDILAPGKGQTLVATVNAERRGGFNGEIAIRVEGTPAGLAVSPLTIPAGVSSGILTFTTAGDAAPAANNLHIFGEATPDGKTKVTREAVSYANLPRPGEGQVVSRRVAFQFAAVSDAVPLFTLTPEMTGIALTPGQTVMVKVKAGRKAGDNNANPAIALSLANLPPGVSAETPTIPEKQGEVTIKLTAAADAKPATYTGLLTGKLGDVTQPAPGLIITVKGK